MRFAQNLSPAQVKFARKIEKFKLASYSQAVKALECWDNEQIAAWKEKLNSIPHEQSDASNLEQK